LSIIVQPRFSLIRLLACLCCVGCLWGNRARAAEPASEREVVVQAILASGSSEKRDLLGTLVGRGDQDLKDVRNAWRGDALFVLTDDSGEQIPVQLVGSTDAGGAREALRVIDGEPLRDAAGNPMRLVGQNLTSVGHSNALRRAMKEVTDVIDLSAPDAATRIQAIEGITLAQDATKLPLLEERLELETNGRAIRSLREAIALIHLNSEDEALKLQALRELEDLHTLSSTDFLRRAQQSAEQAGNDTLAEAASDALQAVEQHRSAVDFMGTIFRGLSLGSILLVAALGLAITFGLMRVINMAHGEMIAVGAYTTYLIQNIFGAGITIPFFGLSLPIFGLNLEGTSYQLYFLFAIPCSFLTAALAGIALERTVIRFLYRRPLESLLATWGVSLILQQTFRLVFGANNVQVSSPTYLSGNWTIADVLLGWNRVFVIGFAIVIVIGVWLALTRTSLGLLIRASMQNRSMASCMGVRTERVNMLTFGLGSGLAGLAGAFLSQIGNVGPSLGQSYIIDSFMVVVIGGVGSIAGTIISAFGIGGVDQVLQQYLPSWAPGLSWVPGLGSFLQNLAQDAAVFGKILVLACIILFLQWKPSGLFVTRSRSLDE